jgi:hypothetical protein
MQVVVSPGNRIKKKKPDVHYTSSIDFSKLGNLFRDNHGVIVFPDRGACHAFSELNVFECRPVHAITPELLFPLPPYHGNIVFLRARKHGEASGSLPL